MARSERLGLLALLAAPAVCCACTFTGLGNYDVGSCPAAQRLGATAASSDSLPLASASISSLNGTTVGAFLAGSGCVEAVGGSVSSSACMISGELVPAQPFVVPIGFGYVAAAVTQSACKPGAFTVSTLAGSTAGHPQSLPCTMSGASLPSVVPAPDGSDAFVTWYGTSYTSRADPLESCAAAVGAPLMLALVQRADTSSPSVPHALPALTQASTSVRPAAMTATATQVLVAAPDGNAASVWVLDGASGALVTTVSVAGLAGARGVAIAEGPSDNLAVVGEIGCNPQAIVLSLGTVAGGFAQTTTVAAKGTGVATQPTVAWVSAEGYWIVSWISAGSGGHHALAQRIDPHGNLVGTAIDPGGSALAAAVMSTGNLFTYDDAQEEFESVGLGCAEGPEGTGN